MFLIAWQRKIKLVQSKRDITLLQTDSHMQRCSVCPPIISNQKSPGLLHGKPIIVFPTNTAFLWKRAMYINVFSREGERDVVLNMTMFLVYGGDGSESYYTVCTVPDT